MEHFKVPTIEMECSKYRDSKQKYTMYFYSSVGRTVEAGTVQWMLVDLLGKGESWTIGIWFTCDEWDERCG